MNDLRLKERDGLLTKTWVLLSRLQEHVPEGFQLMAGVFGVFFQEFNKELVLGLLEQPNDALIPRVIHIDVELAENHAFLFILGVLFAVLLWGRLPEDILLSHGRHVRAIPLPLGLDIDHATGVSLPGLGLFQPSPLLILGLLFFSHGEPIFGDLPGIAALFKGNLAEREVLD